MRKRQHCRPVTVPMSLPALAQFDVDNPPSFDGTCDTAGPVSALQVKLCAIDNAIELVVMYQRQIPFIKGHTSL